MFIWARRLLADHNSSSHRHPKVRREKRSCNKAKDVPAHEVSGLTCIASSTPLGTDQLSSFGSFDTTDDIEQDTGKAGGKDAMVDLSLVDEDGCNDIVRSIRQRQRACNFRKHDTFEIAQKGKGGYRCPSRRLGEGR